MFLVKDMEDPKRIKCSICGKEMNKSSLKKHMENIHNKIVLSSEKGKSKGPVKIAKNSAKEKVPDRVKRVSRKPAYIVPEGEYEKAVVDMNEWEFINTDEEAELTSMMNDMSISSSNSASHPPPPVPVPVKKPMKPRSQPELIVQRKLEKQLGGKHQMTPSGEIDILTDTILCEIKEWKSWKAAVGQTMCYGWYYPNHMKRIHFFGPHPSEEKKIIIFTILTSLGIQFSYEKDKGKSLD